MEAVPKLESDKLKAQKALNDKFRTTEYVRSNRLKFDRRRGETPHANLCGWETNEPEHAY